MRDAGFLFPVRLVSRAQPSGSWCSSLRVMDSPSTFIPGLLFFFRLEAECRVPLLHARAGTDKPLANVVQMSR